MVLGLNVWKHQDLTNFHFWCQRLLFEFYLQDIVGNLGTLIFSMHIFRESVSHLHSQLLIYVSSSTVLAHSQIMHFELFTGVSEFFPHRTAFTSASLRSRLNHQISGHWPWRLTMMMMTSYSASWERYQSRIWKPTATSDAPIQWSISAGANRLAVNVGP